MKLQVNVFVTLRKRVELCALWFPPDSTRPLEGIKLSDEQSTKCAIGWNKSYLFVTNCMEVIPLRSDFMVLLLAEEKEES